MKIKIKDIVNKLEDLATANQMINEFGYGARYDIMSDPNFPYFYVVIEPSHTLEIGSDGYAAIEYNFYLRCADILNVTVDYPRGNSLDVLNDTMSIMVDMINAIASNHNNMFEGISLSEDISIEPFLNEDNSNVCGVEADVTFRVVNDNKCITPIT